MIVTDFFRTLKQHYNQILNFLCRVDELVAWLFEKACLHEPQRQRLVSFNTPYHAAEQLLNFIMKHSQDTYHMFLVGLLNTEQHHIYKVLTEKGTRDKCVFRYSGSLLI
jgi:hypothetical protein